jgi:L-iditol 2-dehydrogenase
MVPQWSTATNSASLNLACELGADVALNSNDVDAPAEVFKRTDGQGADVAVEVVGIGPALRTAIASLKKGGCLALVGNVKPTVEFPLQSVVTRQITLYGSCASNGEYPACLEMLARGSIKVDSIISAVAPLSEGASWFRRLHDREPGLMKVILTP